MTMSLENESRKPIINPEIVRYFRGKIYSGPISQSFGFHGTSIETVQTIMEKGVLPGRTRPLDQTPYSQPTPGDVFMWKTKWNSDGTLNTTIYDALSRDNRYNPFEESVGYAELIAQRHCFARLTGLDITNKHEDRIAGQLSCNEDTMPNSYVKEMWLRGFTRNQLEAARRIANTHKGVVIGLSCKIENDYPIIDVNLVGDDGWKIVTGARGLPFTYITGLVPLGPTEFKSLHNWLRQ
jgi:hypothetical protein